MADQNGSFGSPLQDSQAGFTEGSFEWIGRPSARQSDDEEAESIVSYDVSTADEDLSVIGTDFSDGEAQDTVSRSPELLAREFIPPSHPLQASGAEGYVRASHASSAIDTSSLEGSFAYTECGTSHSGFTEALGSLEFPNGDELVLKYGLAKEHQVVSDRQPFRILLVGEWAREENPVVEKVAQAMAAGQAQTRTASSPSEGLKLSIVPLSNFWQMASAPEVALIESTGLEIVVDHFGIQDFVRTRTASANGERRTQDFKVPDLAILLHSPSENEGRDDSPEEEEMFQYVRLQTSAVVELAADGSAPYLKTAAQTFPGSLSSTISTKASETGHTEHQAQLVEVSAFTKIQSLQLSRHIAYLTSLSRVQHRKSALRDGTDNVPSIDWVKIRSKQVKDWMITGWSASWKKAQQLLVRNDAAVYKAMIAVLTTTLLAFTIQTLLPIGTDSLAMRYSPQSSSTSLEFNQVTESLAFQKPSHALLLVSSAFTPASVGIQTAPSKIVHPSSVSQSKSSSMPSNGNRDFEIVLAKDGNVLIQAPPSMQRQRGLKNAVITVTRNGEPLEVSIDDIGMGTYMVRIPARSLSGVLQVQVQAENYPEVIRELNLGNTDTRLAPDMVKEIAIRLSQESMKLSKVASHALSESSMTLNTLLARSAEWQRRSLQRLHTSQAHLETITTALGQHFASQQEWLQDFIQTSQDGITKSLSAIHGKASTDIQKYRKRTSKRLHKMHKKAARSLAKAQKRALRDLNRASKDLAVSTSKFNGFGQRAKKVRQFVLQEAARTSIKHGRVLEELSRDVFRKAQNRAHKIWTRAPRSSLRKDAKLGQSQRTRRSR